MRWVYPCGSPYRILGNFVLLNFRENGDFNNFVKNIFVNDPRGNIKGVAWQYFAKLNFALILQLSKICEIRENKAMRKFPGIRYHLLILEMCLLF